MYWIGTCKAVVCFNSERKCEVETCKKQSNQGTGLPDDKGEAFDIVRSLILCFL